MTAAALNHLLDRRADAVMARTAHRPLPMGELDARQVLAFALVIGALSMLVLVAFVNVLTAVLTFASLIGYAVVYTVWLKRATPQNIVIGGAAGAAPPVLGWTAVTGEVHAHALLLFLIIFIWTPPHFWALAIYRRDDYARAAVPMLPVTHGVEYTRAHVLYYTVLLVLVTVWPYLTGMSGLLYLGGALVLGAGFLYYAIRLLRPPSERFAMEVFGYSIVYLMALFAFLLADHYLAAPPPVTTMTFERVA
jgi:heme o synthase